MQITIDKIHVVGDRVIVAGSGSVGLGQRFVSIVEEHWNNKAFQQPPLVLAKSLSTDTIKDFRSTGLTPNPHTGFNYGALLATPLIDKPHLIEYGILDFQPEIRQGKMNFLSMGTGQILAEPFLAFIKRTLWDDEVPNVKNAIFGVFWTLSHAIKFAPGNVGLPINIATLQKRGGKWKAEILDDEILQEQEQHIGVVEARIRNLPTEVFEQAEGVEPPAPPA